MRSDKIVLQTLDRDGVYDFIVNENGTSNMKVRIISDESLKSELPRQIKFRIFGIRHYLQNQDEFLHIFREILLHKQITGIFSLLEFKPDKVLECYAGDLIYDAFRGDKKMSFRQLLISENLACPAHADADLNTRLFYAFANFISQRMDIMPYQTSGMSIQPYDSASASEAVGGAGEIGQIIHGKYQTFNILGEGHVSNFFFKIA